MSSVTYWPDDIETLEPDAQIALLGNWLMTAIDVAEQRGVVPMMALQALDGVRAEVERDLQRESEDEQSLAAAQTSSTTKAEG